MMDERQRRELFELWKSGVPFPQLSCLVSCFMQDAVEQYKQLRGCVGKKKYGDMATARYHAARMHRRYKQGFNSYRCDLCHAFHVGSQRETLHL